MMIKFLVMDVDGTLTDGKIYMGADGEMMKAFDVKDGCGIKDILPTHGILPVIITGRSSGIVENRCRELNIQYLFQNVRDKACKLASIIDQFNRESGTDYTLKDVAFIGDDILDLSCIHSINAAGGLTGAPSDAMEVVRTAVSFVSRRTGGSGAVRDFIEHVVSLRNDD